MNISDATTGFVPLRGASRFAAVSPAVVRPQSDPAGVSEGRPAEVEPGSGRLGSEVAGRLDAAVEKLRDRLEQLTEGRELSSDQVAQLREAEAHLQATLERIHNALDERGLAPSTVRLGFRAAIGEMQSAVQDVLAADDAPTPAPVELGNVVSLGQAGAVTQVQPAPGQGEQQPADPVLERLAFAEERMAGRIDDLLQSDDLSQEQREALLATQQEFGATLDRLRNAMEGGVAPVTVARGFRVALGQFRQGVDGALATGGTDGDGAGQTNVIDPRTAQRMEQLHHAGERIDQRLENLIARDGLGEDQIAALEEARSGFQAALDGLRGSLLSSDMDVADVRKAFMEVLDGLRDEVHGALNAEGPEPVLYTQADGIDRLGRDHGTVLDQRA